MKATFTINMKVSWERKAGRKGEIELSPEIEQAVTQTLQDGQQRLVNPKDTAPVFWVIMPRNPWIPSSEHHDDYKDVTIYACTGVQGMGILKEDKKSKKEQS